MHFINKHSKHRKDNEPSDTKIYHLEGNSKKENRENTKHRNILEKNGQKNF